MRSLVAALRFLTRLPLPGPATLAVELPAAVAWFPLVGALVGAAIGAAAVGCAHWWPPAIAAVLAIAAGLLLTGGFHEDAASDAADGLGGGGDREQVLRIMHDSRIGAYGAMGLWLLLTLRWAALLALIGAGPVPAVAGMALAGAWGRWTCAPLLRLLPPLGEGLSGTLGKDIRAGATRPALLASALVAAISVAAWSCGVERAPLAAGAALLATALWWRYLARRLGGQSGDLLGAGNQIAEAAALLALLARHV